MIVIGKDEKGEFHEGNSIVRVQENGKLEVLCPYGHLIAYDVLPELSTYYKWVRCYGRR